MSSADVIQRSPWPVTVTQLQHDLEALGVTPGGVVVVHSSLSALGWVCGGAQAVVETLQQLLGPDGTLVMPAHSGDLSDPAAWQQPPVPEAWWPIIRETMPAFDPARTGTWGMGAVVECFRAQADVRRSAHPQVSFVARGPLAEAITANHELAWSLGEGSPLAQLYQHQAQILLLGVGHEHNTSLHLAEYRANYPGKRQIRQGAPMLINGQRQWVWFDDLDLDTMDFEQIGEAFASATGLVQQGAVGHGQALLLPQAALIDFAVRWMEQYRNRR